MSVDTNSISDVDSVRHDVVWRPSAEHLERSRLLKFMQRYGIKDLPELQKSRSRIRAGSGKPCCWTSAGNGVSVRARFLIRRMGSAWSKWFVDGRVNYTTNASIGTCARRIATSWRSSGRVRTARSAASPIEKRSKR